MNFNIDHDIEYSNHGNAIVTINHIKPLASHKGTYMKKICANSFGDSISDNVGEPTYAKASVGRHNSG